MNTPTLAIPWASETTKARAAQRTWAEIPISKRLPYLKILRHRLVADAEQLCAAVESEIARPPAEVLSTNIIPTAEAIQFLERSAVRLLRPTRISRRQRPIWLWGQQDIVHRRPYGVVGIIGTWNYPIFLNLVQIVQALTAGNAVIWKPSELIPQTAEYLHRLLVESGYSPDLVPMLPATREAGPTLVEADIDHLVFTGSAAVGRRIAARLGERLISSTLELSGVDAMFVSADADLTLAARATWFGVTLNNGQTCLAVRRVFVERSVYPAFADELRKMGTGASPVSLVLPSQIQQANELLREAESQGATLWRAADLKHDPQMISPTVVFDAQPDMRICRESAFAPIAAVLPFESWDEAIRMHERCEYGLGAALFTSDHRKVEWLASRIPVGVVTVNDVIVPTAHPATPFGGRKASGWSVTQGGEGLLAMTVPQVVSVRSGGWRPHFEALDDRSPTFQFIQGWMKWQHGGPQTRWSGLRQMLTTVIRRLRPKHSA